METHEANGEELAKFADALVSRHLVGVKRIHGRSH
jgi:hypothetical protein